MPDLSGIDPEAYFARSHRVVANALNDDEVVMLDIENGTYFGLQDVGKSVWDLLERPTALDSIVRQLLVEYDVDEPTCRAHVLELLAELAEQGLVDVSDAPADS